LGIAKSTVSNHVQVILQKLHAHNIAEAIATAAAKELLCSARSED
jgi:DNA-binding NarL/FixJ family response regulator